MTGDDIAQDTGNSEAAEMAARESGRMESEAGQ